MRSRAGVVCGVAALLLVSSTSAAGADPTWTQVATGMTGGVSGLAPATSGWVIVRDNKLAGQNRIALLGDDGSVTQLTWPGVAPQDLESVAAVPGQSGQYAALTSAGSGTVVSVAGTSVTVLLQFKVPRGTSNIESFALAGIGTATVAVWATRGSATAAAKVFAATFDAGTGTFGAVATGTVTVPYPTTNLRQIADLAVVGGRLVGSSTSDPGNNGPFTSALYGLGSVGVASGRAVLGLQPPQSLGTYAGHKIEGIACSGTTGLLGSDDEKQGGWIRTESFCG